MAEKKDDKKEDVEDVKDEIVDGDEGDGDGDGDDEDNWSRFEETVDRVVGKRLEAWSAANQQQKTISTRSPRKPVKKAAPTRKQGFFSSGMFKGLSPEE
jgi:chemotaxis protein CheY-P-specific phosphatase CheC